MGSKNSNSVIHAMPLSLLQESAISIGTKKDSRLTTIFEGVFPNFKRRTPHHSHVPAVPDMVVKSEFKTTPVRK
jgi:hypothetical protein